MKTFVIEKDGTNHIVEIEKPQITDEQALVKMIACGMCGTDVKLLHRTFKGFPESIYPIMLGHEGIGEVVAVGAKVKGYRYWRQGATSVCRSHRECGFWLGRIKRIWCGARCAGLR